MNILIAPDSFKGSLSAVEASHAMAEGARRVFPHSQQSLVPMADGGEGTLEVIVSACGGQLRQATVCGPLGAPVQANWGLLPDGTAVIEMAEASGLTLVPPARRAAFRASTFGTGQLLLAALDAGTKQILLGLGGSATTDGGAGALTALGARFLDRAGMDLGTGGTALAALDHIDRSQLDARLTNVPITLLCDVQNPLLGYNGAAAVYAPQKGADEETVAKLELGLTRMAEVVQNQTGEDFASIPGAGAAGGLAFGMLAFSRAQLQSGIDTVIALTQFGAKVREADLILTGEGALDQQTLSGKTIAGLVLAVRTASEGQPAPPIIGFAGAVNLSGPQLDHLGLVSAFSLVDGPRDLHYCTENAATLLANAVERALRLWPR